MDTRTLSPGDRVAVGDDKGEWSEGEVKYLFTVKERPWVSIRMNDGHTIDTPQYADDPLIELVSNV